VNFRHSIPPAILLLTAASASLAEAARPTRQGPVAPVTRIDLQRHDLSLAGREAVQLRVDIAPGASAPRHSHPGEEVIYVLQGTLEYRIDGSVPVTLRAGGVLFIPSGAIHSARNVGAGTGSEISTYIVAKGEPLVRPAQ
jgi:quercetin dioxygenase-like cupin family protein